MLQCAIRHNSKLCMQALWRGNGTTLWRILPEVGLRFALHDQLLTMFSPVDGQPLGFSGKLAAGISAGVCICLAVMNSARQGNDAGGALHCSKCCSLTYRAVLPNLSISWHCLAEVEAAKASR